MVFIKNGVQVQLEGGYRGTLWAEKPKRLGKTQPDGLYEYSTAFVIVDPYNVKDLSFPEGEITFTAPAERAAVILAISTMLKAMGLEEYEYVLRHIFSKPAGEGREETTIIADVYRSNP